MEQSVNNLRAEAHAAGYAATSYAACPYISGQRVLSYWQAGFIAKIIASGITPPDTPPYILGRIAYLEGKAPSARPASEPAIGQWMRGWLTQRDLTPRPAKNAGWDANSDLLDIVFD